MVYEHGLVLAAHFLQNFRGKSDILLTHARTLTDTLSAGALPVVKEISLMDSETSRLIDHFLIQLPESLEGDVHYTGATERLQKHTDNYLNLYSSGRRECRSLSDLVQRHVIDVEPWAGTIDVLSTGPTQTMCQMLCSWLQRFIERKGVLSE